MKLLRIIFKNKKMHILKGFIEKSKTDVRYRYWAAICEIKSPCGLTTASELSTGSHDHVSVHGSEYLGYGGHHAGLMGMSVGMSL